MHRVDSDEHLAGKFQNSNPPTTAGTLLEKDWHNAAQEEICRLIETMGITLAASGTADETAGWVQLREALFQKFRGADVREFGADPTGAADSTTAFNDAFAASKLILVPEGTFKLTGTVNFPTSGAVLGRGRSTLIKIASNGKMFDVENDGAFISDLWFSWDTGVGSSSRIISIRHTAAYQAIVSRCMFQVNGNAGLVGIEVDDEYGRTPILINQCEFFGPTGVGIGVRLGIDSSSKSPNLAMVGCKFHDGTKLIEANYGDEVSSQEIIGCHFYDSTLEFNNAEGIHFLGCSIDVDSYDFNTCEGIVFENCYHPHSLANTIPTDAAAKASYFTWKNCKTDDGLTMADGVRGTSSDGSDLTNEAKLTIDAQKSIAASTDEVISTANGYSLTATHHIGPNVNQTKLTLVDASTGNFYKATGSSMLGVIVHVRIDPNGADDDEISVYIQPNAGQRIYVPYGYSSDGPGDKIFSGCFFFPLAKGDYVWIGVHNRDTTQIYVEGGTAQDFIRTFKC